ncbi:hypothetical protein D7Z26_23130 [Cohnella endophytica]|uniref:Periplasmic heavy metal sensor n=1 Tax=Cohnella endophytica TaxID=2419778 RepID=A0A494XFD0_9BACL|nr:hypothetical protein [Cohnella endophytica]RKP47206.1 hypothetical protein D7Z26_23130 [Cohnella endophytica]
MIHRKLLRIATSALIALAIPSMAAAAVHPGGEHGQHRVHDEHNYPGEKNRSESADWSTYPADIQAIKAQLDKIKSDQKILFETMRTNGEQIREARKTLTTAQKQSLKKSAQTIIKQMKSSREEIHTLRDQKKQAWDRFQSFADSKQWNSAKSELQTILKQKQQIYEKQQSVVKLQTQLLKLISPSHESHIHSVE